MRILKYTISLSGKLIFALAIYLVSLPTSGQGKYGLAPVDLTAYKKSLKASPERELVDLEKFIPGIVLDIRYATSNNFTHERIYQSARAFARIPVANKLREAQAAFQKIGFGIKIYDAYRPYKATVKFYEVYHDTTYVASPYVGSRHNRGCAIDMTLIDLKTGKEVSMPTPYDSFKKEAWPATPVKDPAARKNRALIIRIMKEHGFKVNASEWWHFDFTGWNNYEVMDVDFEELNP